MAEIYHVINRGVDKRKIFLDEQDYMRFVHDLFEFNDEELVSTTYYKFQKIKNDVIARRKIEIPKKPRKFLVNILSFCLMPNHYHLLLTPKVEKGVSRFMKKVNMGYARYFNERYERKGALFEGRYKSIIIKNEAHFVHIPYYIHLNPLDLISPTWRDGELKNYNEAIKFLENYRWSSYLDYIGNKNFPSVTQRELLEKFYNGPWEYKERMKGWLKDLDLESVKEFSLE